jgi:hypothetical protein
MIVSRFAALPVITAALLLIFPGASTSWAADADRVDARFEVFGIAGLHVSLFM